MTVETAQRHLLEALADLDHTRCPNGRAGDPLTALYLGLDFARHMDPDTDEDGPLWPVFTAFEDLILAVRQDLRQPDSRLAGVPPAS